ncbi:MAG: zf-TFIIB domain-containing protein [bacterium]
MYCPRCKSLGQEVPLQQSMLSNIEINVCQTCGGIWFETKELGMATAVDKKEIEQLTQTLSQAKDIEKSQDMEMQCPKCSTNMFKYRYMYTSDIYIDSCEQCEGIWVDKGELLRIVNYLEEASKIDPEKEASIKLKLNQIKLEYQQREKEFIDSLVKMDDKAKNPLSRAFGEVLQSIYSFLYKKGL